MNERIQSLEGKKIVVDLGSIGSAKYTCSFGVHQYNNGRYALELTDIDSGEPFGMLTTNLPHVDLMDNEIIVKTWSENAPLAKAALASGLFENTGVLVPTGFVEAEIWEVL